MKMLFYFLIVFSIMSLGNSEEPKGCSEFYFKDKLLDKMVRLEIKVEKFDEGITQTNTDVLTTLEELKRVREDFKGDVRELKNQVQDSLRKHVHGGWTTWSEWGSCSVTCDIGMQQRDRSCSNPSPSADGDFCHGDAREYRMCIESACANGAWSTWSVWSHCSVTCGTGLQTRQRQCDNPKPSPLGTYCIGSSESVNICFEKACDAGGWTNWNSWSGCSVTCGGGIHSRSRTCTNPIPSGQGHYCVGDSSIVQSCNNKRCPALSSAFAVSGPKEYTSSLSFLIPIYHIGTDFNINTGVLTCTIPGIYIFSTTLVKKRTSTRTVDRVYCDLMQNDVKIIKVYVDPTDDDSDLGNAAVTQTVVLHLNLHDRVYLSGCTPTTSMESWTSFSGFLLTPDS